MRAGLRALAQVRSGAQVRARTARGLIVDARLDRDRLVDRAARADDGVGQARVRADDRILPYLGFPQEEGLREKLNIGRDLDVGADPHRGRVPHGDARLHVLLVDARLQGAHRRGQLDARVHAQALGDIACGKREHVAPGAATNLEHVGQVELALRVVASHLLERLEKSLRVEAVEARVAFGDGGLGGVRVLLLDDALDAPFAVADDAPIAERVVELHGEHHNRRVRAGAHVGELANGIGRDKRAVARQHEQRAVEAGKRILAGEHRVGRAALRLLHDDLGVGHQRLHDLAGVPHHRHDAIGTRLARSVNNPTDEGLAENLVRNLGFFRLHTSSRTCGEHDGGSIH